MDNVNEQVPNVEKQNFGKQETSEMTQGQEQKVAAKDLHVTPKGPVLRDIDYPPYKREHDPERPQIDPDMQPLEPPRPGKPLCD